MSIIDGLRGPFPDVVFVASEAPLQRHERHLMLPYLKPEARARLQAELAEDARVAAVLRRFMRAMRRYEDRAKRAGCDGAASCIRDVCDDHMAGKGAFDDAAWLRAFATSLRERHRRRYGGSTTAAFLYERAADALDKMRADLARKP